MMNEPDEWEKEIIQDDRRNLWLVVAACVLGTLWGVVQVVAVVVKLDLWPL